MRKRYNEFVEKFYRLLSNDRLVLTFICLLGAAICITVALLEIFTGNNLETVFVYFVLIAYLLLMIFLCHRFPAKYDLFAALIMVPVNCAVFPYIFLISDGGGISSGMPIWLTFGLILIYIITNGVYTYVLIAVTVVIDLLLFQFAYLDHPITDLPLDKAYYYRDNIVAIFGVSLITGILLKYQKGIQKRQTERIQKAMQEAEREKINSTHANEAKSRFLANMSHDIRTPMNAIVGMTDMAKFNLDDKEKVKECLDKINASSKQLLHLINNILDMSEIESGVLVLKEKEFNLQELVDNVQVVLEPLARAKKQRFTVEYFDIRQANLIGDAVRLRQVFMNLIGNSIKFTDMEGEIQVRIRQLDSLKKNYASYVFEIQDNGIGMSKEFIQKTIYEPYAREEADTVSKTEGNGIGMSITKRVLDEYKASLEIESEQGKGSLFRIYIELPIDIQRTTVPMDVDGFPTLLDATGKNILVVEDNEINMEIMKEILSRTSANIICAWNGEEAYQIFQESKKGYFDLIFMDVQMPMMNGYETTRAIRALLRDDANVPIVAMTANAFSQDIEKSIECGMNDHLSKPVEIDELFSKMYQYLHMVDGKQETCKEEAQE